MNTGDLVALKEEYRMNYFAHVGEMGYLGTGIVIGEFTTESDELFFEVFWSLGVREYVRPSWLKLIKKNSSNVPKEGV
jgi:hypothetical protein